MLLIVAALQDELDAAMALCRGCRKLPGRNGNLWRGERNGKEVYFLRAGFGPRRSAVSLERSLPLIQPAQILLIGYAGGLDPGVKLGHLVAVRKALEISPDGNRPAWTHVRIDGSFELVDGESLAGFAQSIGLSARVGDVLTTSYVLGDPAHKVALYERFHACIVDMETAALARVADRHSTPLSCIRAISDELEDTFLIPFSGVPSEKISGRLRKLIHPSLIQSLRTWRSHAAVAKRSLSRFLASYL